MYLTMYAKSEVILKYHHICMIALAALVKIGRQYLTKLEQCIAMKHLLHSDFESEI